MSKGPRIERAKAEAIAAQLVDELIQPGLIFITGGSIRREKETVGDIDIAVQCETRRIQDRFNDSLGAMFGYCSTKPERAKRFGDYQGVQINFFDVLPSQIGAALLFCTGSGGFNMRMRCQAKRQGYLLNQYGLWDREDRETAICDATKEEHIFEALDIDFVTPQNRTDRAIGWA